jgi:Flp pilus assembly protein TadG
MKTRLRNRARDDRGTVLVEAVFVFPVAFFIILAVFEFGFLFAAQSTTQSASREGARTGSAGFATASDHKAAADSIRDVVLKDVSALTSYDTPIQLLIYKADGSGNPAGSFASCTANCFHYTWNGTTFVYDNNTAVQWNSPQACIGANSLDSIGVYLEVQHKYITNTFAATQILKEHTVQRLEPLPLSQCP